MLRSKKTPEKSLGTRPKVPITGVARIMGVHSALSTNILEEIAHLDVRK